MVVRAATYPGVLPFNVQRLIWMRDLSSPSHEADQVPPEGHVDGDRRKRPLIGPARGRDRCEETQGGDELGGAALHVRLMRITSAVSATGCPSGTQLYWSKSV